MYLWVVIVCAQCTLIIIIYFVSTDRASDVVVVLQFVQCTVPLVSLRDRTGTCGQDDSGDLFDHGHEIWDMFVQSLRGKRLVLTHGYWT